MPLRLFINFVPMEKHLSLLVVLLLASCGGFSQDSLRLGLSQDSLIRATLVQGIKYPNLVYSANGQVLDRKEIVARLRLYDEPADELQKSRDARAGMAW